MVAAKDLGLVSRLIVNAKVILYCLLSVELQDIDLSSRHLVSCPDPTRKERERVWWHPADSLGLLSPEPLFVGGVWDHQTPLCLRHPAPQTDQRALCPAAHLITPKQTLSVYRKQYTAHTFDQSQKLGNTCTHLHEEVLKWNIVPPPPPYLPFLFVFFCPFSATGQLLLLIAFCVCSHICVVVWWLVGTFKSLAVGRILCVCLLPHN